MRNSKHLFILFSLLGLLSACASSPPSATLPQSIVAVESIDHSNYRKHVGSDVDAVKGKLAQAQTFEAEKQHEQAEYLAQQVLIDVELIQIKTQRLNVEQEMKQVEHSVSNLHEELKWREPINVAPLN